MIKTAIPVIKNRYIPLAALAMGTIIAILINMSSGINAEVILGGMISGLASTGLYEMLRNLIWKKGDRGRVIPLFYFAPVQPAGRI